MTVGELVTLAWDTKIADIVDVLAHAALAAVFLTAIACALWWFINWGIDFIDWWSKRRPRS